MAIFKNKKTVIILTVTATLFAIALFLELSGRINIFGDNHQRVIDSKTKTTSNAPTAQEDFSDGNDREPDTSTKQEGTLTDNRGQVSSIPPSNSWTTSSSGEITVYNPAKNSSVSNGFVLSGKSSYDNISFRLIDDISGVIAQGNLSVINGEFSGSFNYSTESKSGRLDVFNSSDSGVEKNNIEIPIIFK